MMALVLHQERIDDQDYNVEFTWQRYLTIKPIACQLLKTVVVAIADVCLMSSSPTSTVICAEMQDKLESPVWSPSPDPNIDQLGSPPRYSQLGLSCMRADAHSLAGNAKDCLPSLSDLTSGRTSSS
jgi:hypothetical protein